MMKKKAYISAIATSIPNKRGTGLNEIETS